MTELDGVEGELGNFTVRLRRHPRYVDMDRCIACGKCAEVCPRETADEFNRKINTRKAIFVKYPQAVPLKYQIDPVVCNRMRGGRCRECEKACPRGAISYGDSEKEISVKVGSIILSPGYRPFDPCGFSAWGYGRFPNVITAMELERYLAVAGPTAGHLLRPSDGKPVDENGFPPVHRQQGPQCRVPEATARPSAACTQSNRQYLRRTTTGLCGSPSSTWTSGRMEKISNVFSTGQKPGESVSADAVSMRLNLE